MEEDRKKVRIACRHRNGIMIALHQIVKDDLGAPVLRRDGPAVRLNGPSGVGGGTNAGAEDDAPGITEVDAEWWDKWVAQNKGKNPMLDSGLIEEWTENPTWPRSPTGT